MSYEIDRLLAQEKAERAAASRCGSPEARDSHIMMAERCADLAWSLNENDKALPFIPSGLWH